VTSMNGNGPLLPQNHLRFGRGATHFATDFGDLYSITPVSLIGNGHHPHIEVRFQHGLRIDVQPDVLADLYRQIPAALAKLPFAIDGIHDAVGEQ
jgi:hypothetical protein